MDNKSLFYISQSELDDDDIEIIKNNLASEWQIESSPRKSRHLKNYTGEKLFMSQRISEKPLQLRSALKNIYDEFVTGKKLFKHNYNLFSFALVYGVMKSKRYDKNPDSDFIKINTIVGDDQILDVIDIVYQLLDDSNKVENTWQEMLHIADGGLLELKEIYDKNKNFRIPNLVLDAENLWKEKIKDLKNINI